MTKENLQKELKEKIKPGVKASDLKKLKRSKSADDIPSAPPLPHSVPVSRSKSTEPFNNPQYPYTTLVSQQKELEKLQKETTAKSDTIKLLRKKIEDLEQSNPPNLLLQNQLSEKQKDLESLRKQLELTHQELNSLKQNHSNLLDTNLTLKHQSLKDWWNQYEKTKELETELKENVDYASNELIQQDKTINQLRGENKQLKLTNQSLTKDLDLATKLAKLRKVPLSDDKPSWDYLKITLYSLLALWLVLHLSPSQKIEINQNE